MGVFGNVSFMRLQYQKYHMHIAHIHSVFFSKQSNNKICHNSKLALVHRFLL